MITDNTKEEAKLLVQRMHDEILDVECNPSIHDLYFEIETLVETIELMLEQLEED